jgi:pyruvate dehydrogenase E2 component (dihydrolipoamide acetyltransferase)
MMPTDVTMPQMGESIFEGTITKWLKKPGDTVQRDEPLFEISTDKVDAEIPAPASGYLTEIKIAEGATVQINTVVGVISEAAGSSATPAAAASPKAESDGGAA